MSANRIVALFTPVFAATSALVAGYVAKETGLNVSPAELVSVETTVGVAAAASALKWLHGWSVYEKAAKEGELALAEADKYGVVVPSAEKIEEVVQKSVGDHLVKLAAAIPPPPVVEPTPAPATESRPA